MSRTAAFSILVVDDESLVRALAARTLESAGYRVLGAGDGAEALELLEDSGNGIDLVLTDLRMPRVGGLELGRRIAERQRDIPVLYMSGDPFAALAGSDLAMATFLPKPFSPEMLIEVVRRQHVAAILPGLHREPAARSAFPPLGCSAP